MGSGEFWLDAETGLLLAFKGRDPRTHCQGLAGLVPTCPLDQPVADSDG